MTVETTPQDQVAGETWLRNHGFVVLKTWWQKEVSYKWSGNSPFPPNGTRLYVHWTRDGWEVMVLRGAGLHPGERVVTSNLTSEQMQTEVVGQLLTM